MDWLIAAAIGLSDCNGPVVTALGAISGRGKRPCKKFNFLRWCAQTFLSVNKELG
jgi:hypothetical protein